MTDSYIHVYTRTDVPTYVHVCGGVQLLMHVQNMFISRFRYVLKQMQHAMYKIQLVTYVNYYTCVFIKHTQCVYEL